MGFVPVSTEACEWNFQTGNRLIYPQSIIVLGELSFSRMPLRYYCLILNMLHVCNCLPKLAKSNE